MLLAEHHSVWETPGGILIDVTPPAAQADHVLFVRDGAADIVLADGMFRLRTDLTDINADLRILQGNLVEQTLYDFDSTTHHLAVYCEKIGFALENMATDPHLG